MEGKNKANCESICKRQYVDISEKKKKRRQLHLLHIDNHADEYSMWQIMLLPWPWLIIWFLENICFLYI